MVREMELNEAERRIKEKVIWAKRRENMTAKEVLGLELRESRMLENMMPRKFTVLFSLKF